MSDFHDLREAVEDLLAQHKTMNQRLTELGRGYDDESTFSPARRARLALEKTAHVLAAHQNMLEALKALFVANIDNGTHWIIDIEDMKRARAAIAIAQGLPITSDNDSSPFRCR